MGELTEAVRNRSVYRQFHWDNAGGQADCRGRGSNLYFSTAGPLPGYADMPWRQVTAAANSLAADGAEGLAVSIQGCLPVSYEEARLREDMKQFAAEIKTNGMEPGDIHIQVSDQVNAAQYFVNAVGHGLWTETPKSAGNEQGFTGTADLEGNSAGSKVRMHGRERSLCPGQELVVVRQIALTGTAALARLHEEELRRRFPFWLVDHAKEFDQWMSAAEAAYAVHQFGTATVYSVAQGGIFNALWELAECADVGLEVDLRRIPVKQETIEICEYFDLNPYYLYSAGCLLIGTEQAEGLVAALADIGISAAVIGCVTDGNDRVICNGENRRFLDRPKQDELWRLGDGEMAAGKKSS
ncbi:MAG: hypothetical protein LUD12_16390 [Lachnospiraceae bacterium]|nr:hypothetical protein [Lachnospiraceae bacterium]